MPVIKVADRFGLLDKAVLALTKNGVYVGIPGGDARTPVKGEPAPPSNATIGYIQEFGAPDQHIPARPFLVPGVQSAQERIVSIYRSAGKAVLTGDFQAIEAAHQKVGLIATDAVRRQIDDGTFAPLSERTLAARKARGVTREKPLVDTGEMRRSIQYMVKPKKGA
ncbi:hypothetical protein LOK46_10605 [Methylobacterium sp. NMS14P]|uniref:hypothetical protein n=1 Tax=Methylobacterium sp. NMS14P TaxID=2894310 RepID=UPI002358EE65|nr:hypothetical protein [Methylobacterium sp. NMS14P]WCS27240.1 hypothetical protein LOK46_10605 [Methylobacterium sp. NMS14P]